MTITGRILVVEDDPIIAMDVEATLIGEGCEVIGPVNSVRAALATLRKTKPDYGLVDLNLGAEMSFPVIDALAEARIPFVMVTGYSTAMIPAAYRDHPTVDKPYVTHQLIAALQRAGTRPINHKESNISSGKRSLFRRSR